jgi:quinolinate synthase
VADFVGDSLGLSLKVKNTNNKIILFCGVKFMAETAKIICPEKTVLMPEISAGCPMADMITANDLKEFKRKNPKYKIVCYVNSSAEVKAESDICCTSSNAVKVVESIPENEKILFIPDKNLGTYVKNILNRDITLWPGHCSVHSSIQKEEVLELKSKYQNAIVLAHPECKKDVLDISDHILSTTQMIEKVEKIDSQEFIIVTEKGIIHQLKKRYPDKKFYYLERAICANMKKTNIEMIPNALNKLEYEITLPDEIIKKASKAVNRMLELK